MRHERTVAYSILTSPNPLDRSASRTKNLPKAPKYLGTSGNLVLPLVGRPPDGIEARTAQDVMETADDQGEAGTERPGRELVIRPFSHRF